MCAKSGQDTCRFQKVMIKTSFPLVLLKEKCTSLFGGLGILNFVFFLNISSMFNSDFIHIISIFHLDFSHIRVRNQVQKSPPYKSTFRRSRVTLYKIGSRTYEHFGEKPNYCEKQFQELYAELSIVGGSVGMCVAK